VFKGPKVWNGKIDTEEQELAVKEAFPINKSFASKKLSKEYAV
jgi:hypothetical protein